MDMNCLLLFCLCLFSSVSSEKKKDIRDYNDADIERLYEKWEENDEPLEDDELPEYKKPPPTLDFSNIDPSNPENLLKASKKGKTIMTFVSVYGKSTPQEVDEITSIWQASLRNAHIIAERFKVDENRYIFMFNNGEQAWDAKDFLIQQQYCDNVVIESKKYDGVYSPHAKEDL